jgi:hypothetical protein
VRAGCKTQTTTDVFVHAIGELVTVQTVFVPPCLPQRRTIQSQVILIHPHPRASHPPLARGGTCPRSAAQYATCPNSPTMTGAQRAVRPAQTTRQRTVGAVTTATLPVLLRPVRRDRRPPPPARADNTATLTDLKRDNEAVSPARQGTGPNPRSLPQTTAWPWLPSVEQSVVALCLLCTPDRTTTATPPLPRLVPYPHSARLLGSVCARCSSSGSAPGAAENACTICCSLQDACTICCGYTSLRSHRCNIECAYAAHGRIHSRQSLTLFVRMPPRMITWLKCLGRYLLGN